MQADSLPAESPGKRFKGEGNFAYTLPVVPVPFVEKTDNAFLRKRMVKLETEFGEYDCIHVFTKNKSFCSMMENEVCIAITYMQSTSRETLSWRKHKLESRLTEEISITSDMQMTPPLWQKVKKN